MHGNEGGKMSIIVTPAASSEVKSILESQNLPQNTHLRLKILGGGCSGMQYSLGFDTEFDPKTDMKYDSDDVSLVTEKKFDLHLDGTVVDFVDSEFARGFSIENPNFPAGGGCPGCGGH